MQASSTGPRVDIYAPGMNIISGVYDNTGDSGPTSSSDTITENGSTYQKYNGTSMATAQVTGYLALVLEKYPAFTQSQIKTYLLSHATFGKMFESFDGYTDVTSLQDGNNLILYYYKDRAEQGTVFPSYALGVRPTDGITYPRVKIRRT
jgi:subtilisin family serine protease